MVTSEPSTMPSTGETFAVTPLAVASPETESSEEAGASEVAVLAELAAMT